MKSNEDLLTDIIYDYRNTIIEDDCCCVMSRFILAELKERGYEIIKKEKEGGSYEVS